MIDYPSPEGHGTIKGLMAKPAGASGRLPAVLVIHENRGLNPLRPSEHRAKPTRSTVLHHLHRRIRQAKQAARGLFPI